MRDYLGIPAYKEAHPKTSYPALMARHLFERLQLRQGMTFVDVGCGEGFFLQGFAACGLQVIGVDSSALSVQLHPELTIRSADLENGQLPLEDASCDVIFSKSFIEHLYYPEKYFQDAMRALKPGGLLVTLTPDWQANYKIFYNAFTHRTPFTCNSLRVLYELSGFNAVVTQPFYQLPCAWRYPWLSHLFKMAAPFISQHNRHPFWRWVRTLQVLGIGTKPM